MPGPGLSKSRYLSGRQCPRRLWLGVHRPELASEPDAAREGILEMGQEVGRAAHALFPGGVLVEEGYREHAAAVERTRALLAEGRAPAVFEAAFTHAGVRIRVDALERLGDGRFGLREVKSSTRVKPEHLPDLAVQLWVLRGCGLEVPSVELVHVDPGYVRGAEGIDWRGFFARADCAGPVEPLLAGLGPEVAALHAVLAGRDAPDVEPARGRCSHPFDCEFWAHCTAGRSAEWFLGQKRVRDERRALWLEALRSGRPWVSPDLAARLGDLRPPLAFLDFEACAPAIPLYAGTRPFERVAFQWSLHTLDAAGRTGHAGFLADAADGDPRRRTAESLLAALAALPPQAPIVCYSPYEAGVLGELAAHLPERAAALDAVRARLVDLLPVVRNHVYHPAFEGSFSLKAVAPALVPGLSYGHLEQVAEGAAAAAAWARMATGALDAAQVGPLRRDLLAYCAQDTRALLETWTALRALSPASSARPGGPAGTSGSRPTSPGCGSTLPGRT